MLNFIEFLKIKSGLADDDANGNDWYFSGKFTC